jgi:hypothetical protein
MGFAPVMTLSRFNPPVFGFPDKLEATLRYHATFSITSTSGVVSNYIFRWNSTFDPDFTSGGHQPLYRDTFASIYDHYSVISAKAKISLLNGTTEPWIAGCVTDDDTTLSSTIDTLCEQSHGYHKQITPLTGSKSLVIFNPKWDCKKVLSIDPYASETYKTGVASNPAEESELGIWAATLSGNTATLTGDIELEQYVLWSELTTPTGS